MSLFFSFASAMQYWRVAHLTGMPYPRPVKTTSLSSATARRQDITCIDLHNTGLDGKPMHLLVNRPEDRRWARDVVCHVHSLVLPEGSFFTLGREIYVASPELLFLQSANSSSLIELVELGFELCGGYALLPERTRGISMPHLPKSAWHDLDAAAEKGMIKRPPLTNTAKARLFLDQMHGESGSARAAKALQWVVDGSASPMETTLALLLCLPPRYGGYGLPLPEMNYRVNVTSNVARVDGKNFYSCDLCWSQFKLGVEYDSDACHAGHDRRVVDNMRRNGLEHLGMSVISVSSRQVMNALEFDKLAHQIAARIEKRLRKPTPDQLRHRIDLRKHLLDFARNGCS